jgi:GntR family transcriptional regulator
MSLAMYAEIRADLEGQIRRGELPVNGRVPTEAEVQRTYGVSRATAQRGTFVADGAQQLNLLRMITPEPHGPEMPGRHRVHEARVVEAADADVTVPGVAPETAVVQLRRVKLTPEEVPIALELSVVPFSVAPRLLSEELEDLAMHDYFTGQGIEVVRSRLYVEPECLAVRDADLLGAEAGAAVLRFRRMSWLASGAVAEVMCSTVKPGQAEFFLEQTTSQRLHHERPEAK